MLFPNLPNSYTYIQEWFLAMFLIQHERLLVKNAKKKKKEYTAKCKTFTVCEVLNFEPGNKHTHTQKVFDMTD